MIQEPEHSVQIHVRIPVAIAARIRERAARNRRSMNAEILVIFEDVLEAQTASRDLVDEAAGGAGSSPSKLDATCR